MQNLQRIQATRNMAPLQHAAMHLSCMQKVQKTTMLTACGQLLTACSSHLVRMPLAALLRQEVVSKPSQASIRAADRS